MTKKKLTLDSILRIHIPYRIMLMLSPFEDASFILNHHTPGTYFARQAIALVKIRDLFKLLTDKSQRKGLKTLKKEEISNDDLVVIESLALAASKAEAHTVFDEDHRYEQLELAKGIKILFDLINEHWYKPNGLELISVMEQYNSAQLNTLRNLILPKKTGT